MRGGTGVALTLVAVLGVWERKKKKIQKRGNGQGGLRGEGRKEKIHDGLLGGPTIDVRYNGKKGKQHRTRGGALLQKGGGNIGGTIEAI